MAQNVDPHRGRSRAASQISSHGDAPDVLKRGPEAAPLQDNHAVSKRLQKELMELMRVNDKGVSAFPEGENLFKWIGTIRGAPDTVYAGHAYRLSMEFPHSYPYSAPTVKFLTPCFHPNVDSSGAICLDILKDKWSALYDVRTVLISIQSLLAEPNVDSPLNTHASELWSNQIEYKRYLDDYYAKHKDL